MAETYGNMSYADIVRPREKSSDPLLAQQSILDRAKHSIENGSQEGRELYGRQQSELHDREKQNLQEKQNIHKQTKQEIVDIRPLSLSDVRSPAGLSHYIDRSGDEAMKILEEQIGLNSTWKILALTAMYTSVELGKGLADILKIGEGTAEGSLALDRTDLSTLEKTLAMTKGVGLDGLRALAIAGPALSKLGQVLKNVKVPENLLRTTSNEGPKMGDYRAFGGQRGAVGERRKLSEENSTVKSLKAISGKEQPVPQTIGDLGKFDLRVLKPIDCLNNLTSLNKKLNTQELIGNFRGISEFTNSIERLSIFILRNPERFGARLAEDIFYEIKNLKGVIRSIIKENRITVLQAEPLMTTVENNLNNAMEVLRNRFIHN